MFDTLQPLMDMEDTDFLQPDPPPAFPQNGPRRRRKRQMADMVTDPLTLSCWMGPDLDDMMSAALPLQNIFGAGEGEAASLNGVPSNDSKAVLVSDILGPMPHVVKDERSSNGPKNKKAKNCYSPISVPKKMLPCPVPGCSKEFSDRSGLRKHRKAKHSFACPHSACGKIFPTMEGMLAHMADHSSTSATNIP